MNSACVRSGISIQDKEFAGKNERVIGKDKLLGPVSSIRNTITPQVDRRTTSVQKLDRIGCGALVNVRTMIVREHFVNQKERRVLIDRPCCDGRIFEPIAREIATSHFKRLKAVRKIS